MFCIVLDITGNLANIKIDGKSFGDEIIEKEESQPAMPKDRPLFFYCSKLITAARMRNYKIHYYTSTYSGKFDILLNYRRLVVVDDACVGLQYSGKFTPTVLVRKILVGSSRVRFFSQIIRVIGSY